MCAVAWAAVSKQRGITAMISAYSIITITSTNNTLARLAAPSTSRNRFTKPLQLDLLLLPAYLLAASLLADNHNQLLCRPTLTIPTSRLCFNLLSKPTLQQATLLSPTSLISQVILNRLILLQLSPSPYKASPMILNSNSFSKLSSKDTLLNSIDLMPL